MKNNTVIQWLLCGSGCSDDELAVRGVCLYSVHMTTNCLRNGPIKDVASDVVYDIPVHFCKVAVAGHPRSTAALHRYAPERLIRPTSSGPQSRDALAIAPGLSHHEKGQSRQTLPTAKRARHADGRGGLSGGSTVGPRSERHHLGPT